MPLSKTFYSTFPGLNTSDSRYRLPEGSFTKALNVTIIKADMVEPRHGIPPWEVFRYDENAPLRYELANYAPRAISIDDFSQVGGDFYLTIANPGWNEGDTIGLELVSGTLPTGYPPIGGVQTGPKTGPTTYQMLNMTSITADPGSKYLLTARNNRDNIMQNIYYWRNGKTERYVIMAKNSTQYGSLGDMWTTYLIQPQNYFNPGDISRYNKIRESFVDRAVPTPFSYPRYITSNKGLYISEPTKWICLRNGDFPVNTPEYVKQAEVTIIGYKVAEDVENGWLKPGYAVRIKAVASKILEDGAELEGRPTDFIEVVNNTGKLQTIQLTINTNKPVSAINIYRTSQYITTGALKIEDGKVIPYKVVPEVNYKLADSVTTSTQYGNNYQFTSFLNFNDDLASTLGDLYTNYYEEGDVGANMDMPACGDAYNYKGHTFFGDVLTYPIAKLSIVSLQATGSTLALDGKKLILSYFAFGQDFITELTFRNNKVSYVNPEVEVAMNPPSNLGETTFPEYGAGYGQVEYITNQYTAPGASETPNNGMRIRTYAYDPVTKLGDAVPNGTSAALPAIAANNLEFATTDGDFAKFNVVGGGFLYISGSGVSDISSLISYASVEKTTTGLLFKTVKVVGGNNMTVANGDAISLFYIPGTNIKNLPLYLGAGRSGSNDVGADLTKPAYLSLLPSRNRPQFPISVINTLTIGAPVVSMGRNYISASVYPIGATDRSISQLIAETAKNLAKAISYHTNGQISARPGEEVGQLFLIAESYGAIRLRVSDIGIGDKFNPPLTTTFQTLSNPKKERSKNGVIVSKQANPELIPFASYTGPQPVGNSQNRIRRITSLKDQIYFFKENEGIYTVDVEAGNGEFGKEFFKEISPLDLTIMLIAPESLQSIDEQIIFLSNKGFARLQFGRVDPISKAIDIEIKINSARTPDLEKVSSYVDSVKNLYICHLPDVTIEGYGVTYVYNLNSQQWTTSDVEFDWGVADNIGRATTISSDYRIIDDPKVQQSINNTDRVKPRELLTQYLRQEALTGRILEGVVTNMFDPVVNNDGDDLIVLRQAVNILNSSYDQYDEKIVGFSNITLNGLTSVTLTRSAAQQGQKKDYSLRWFTQRLKGKQLYLKTFWNGRAGENIPVSLIDSGENISESFITLALPPKTTSVAINTTTDELLVGVNAQMEIAPFYFQAPQFLKQWSEGQFQFQNRIEPQSLPIILNVSYAVDDQSGWSKVTSIDRRELVSGVYRALVPLSATRGRYLRIKIEHNIPENYFQFCSVTLAVRNTSSIKSVQVS